MKYSIYYIACLIYIYISNSFTVIAGDENNVNQEFLLNGDYGPEIIYNGDFRYGNIGFISDYQYTNLSLDKEGYYSITNNPKLLHYPFASCANHSINDTLMMVINGDTINSRIEDGKTIYNAVWSQVLSVAKNTDYSFSFWHTIVELKSPAVLDVLINDVSICKSPIVLSSDTCNWKKTELICNTGDTNTIVLKIIDVSRVQDGNDFAIDDISFRPICSLNIDLDSSLIVCPGDTITMPTIIKSGMPPYDITWHPSKGLSSVKSLNPDVYIDTTTTFYLSIVDGYGCIQYDTITIKISDLPNNQLTINKALPVCPCDSITIAAPEGYSYIWSNSETSQSITVNQSGTYTVLITNENGCSTTALQEIEFMNTELAIKMDTIAAATGDIINMPIRITNYKNLKECGYLNYSGEIRFNKSLLYPLGYFKNSYIDGDEQVIGFESTDSDTILTNILFRTLLGDDSCTAIKFNLSSFKSDCEKINIIANQGLFCLSNLCYEPVARLIKTTPKLYLSQNYPNPFIEDSMVDFTIIEQGLNRLYLVDIFGEIVLMIDDSITMPGQYQRIIDGSKLTAGNYFCILETPSKTLSIRVEIVK